MEGDVTVKSEKPARDWKSAFRINRKLIPMKIFLLLHYGGFAALYPYLSLHIDSIGISVQQLGIIYTIYPICNCLGGPIAGVIGDKTGRFKLTLIVMHVLSIIFHLLLLAVPTYRTVPYQFDGQFTQLQVNLSCEPPLVTSEPIQVLTSLQKPTNCSALGVPGNIYHINHCIVRCAGVVSIRDCAGSSCSALQGQLRNFNATAQYSNTSNGKRMEENGINWSGECVPQQNCSVSCNVEGSFTVPCYGQKDEGSQLTTFTIYLAIRLLCGMAINIAFTIMDASLIQMVEDFNGDVGINRAYILLGYCLMPPLSGWLIDVASRGQEQTDYRPAFYIFGICMSLAAATLFFTDLRVRKPVKNLFKNASKLLAYPRVVGFLTVYMFIGVGWGFLETFLFVFLKKSLQAPQWFLGLTNTVGGVAGLPFAFGATWIILKTGYTNVFVFGLSMMALRLVGYSLVTRIWWVLPLEALEAFTSTLPVTAATVYASTFSNDLIATLQGVIAALHYGVGRGIGSFMGGFMIGTFGSRESFRIMAYICLAYAIFHFFLHFFYLRRLTRPRKTAAELKPLDAKMNLSDADGATQMALDSREKPLLYDGSHGSRQSVLPDLVPPDLVGWGSSQGLDGVGRSSRLSGEAPVVAESENLLVHRRHSIKHVV